MQVLAAGPSARVRDMEETIVSVVGDLVRATPGAISLGQGVVHYPPPDRAFEQVRAFLEQGTHHRYTPVTGLPALIDAVREKLGSENGIAVEPDSRIVITAGGNMAFVNTVMAVTDPGDEVIIPLPYYFNHRRAVMMAGCRCVVVPTDSDYQLQPDRIREAVTDRTRAVVTVSPNNPTGAVYRESDLREVNDICRAHGLYHISDEPYEYFTYGGAVHFSPGSIAEAGRHTVSLFSLSKTYGFASWRVGYMVVPEHLFTSVEKVQDVMVICPPGISQFAALGALEAGRDYCLGKVAEMDRVRRLVMDRLRSISDICTVPETQGAFYLLLKVHSDMAPAEMAERLVREHGVGVIPGTSFGLDEGCYLRISYGGLDGESVAQGAGRLVTGLRELVGLR